MLSSSRNHLTSRATTEAGSTLAKLVLVVAIAEPLMTIPQIYEIWSTRTAAGVSLLTWSLYIIASSVWLVYGLKIKNRPLMITGALWTLVELSVVAGVLVWS